MSVKSVSAALLLAALPAIAEPPGTPLDGIIAVVDDEVVLRSELDHHVAQTRLSVQQQGHALPPSEVLRRQVLDRLILERIQLQRAERMGITVSEDRLNETMNNIARSNGMTLDELTEALAADGMTFAQAREDVRNDLILSQLRQRDVAARVNVTQREVDAFLAGEGAGALDNREFRVGHVMLRVPGDATPGRIDEIRALGEDIVRRVRAGEDFGALAVAHSQGQQALDGGDLGWRRSTQLPAAFAERIVGMQAGEVSDLIRTPGAFHVIHLVDSRGGGERVVVQQTRARHILIRTNQVVNDARASARLADLRRQILAGADFGELARRNSEDPGSAVNDGDLGWLESGQTVPAFEEVMAALDVGEVSEPFATQFGWHIVKVTDRRTHDDTEQQRIAQARQILRERKSDEQLEIWLRRLRDEAYVENRLE